MAQYNILYANLLRLIRKLLLLGMAESINKSLNNNLLLLRFKVAFKYYYLSSNGLSCTKLYVL